MKDDLGRTSSGESESETDRLGGTPPGASSPKEESSGVVDLRAIAASAGLGSAPAASPTPFQGMPAALPDAGSRPQRGGRHAAAWLSLTAAIAGSAALGGIFFGRASVSRPDAGSAAKTAIVGSTDRGAAPAAPAAAARAAVVEAVEGQDATVISPSSSEVTPSEVTPGAPPRRGQVVAPSRASSGPGGPIASGAPPGALRAAGDRAALPARPPSNSADRQTDLSALMQQAVGGTSPRAAVGASSARVSDMSAAEGVPLKPAFGAVQGAVGTALPAARACLGPDDPIARATMTFRSDGSVENVVVGGDAAGKPAEVCIRRALLAARLPPFAAPTFTWTTTVRPP